MDKTHVLIILSFLIFSCQPLSREALEGDWEAITVVEEGDTLDLDLTNVSLTFDRDRFKYRHTQRDSLSGVYELSKDLIELFVDSPGVDTIVIQVSDLQAASLVLRMNHEGKERLVTLVK